MREIILQVDEEQYQEIVELAGENSIEQFVLSNTLDNDHIDKKCWVMLENSFNNYQVIKIYLEKADLQKIEFLAFQRGVKFEQYVKALILTELQFNRKIF